VRYLLGRINRRNNLRKACSVRRDRFRLVATVFRQAHVSLADASVDDVKEARFYA
jgi:hypothetical protein